MNLNDRKDKAFHPRRQPGRTHTWKPHLAARFGAVKTFRYTLSVSWGIRSRVNSLMAISRPAWPIQGHSPP